MATINSRIKPILEERFHELLEDELFAHVGWHKTESGLRSYHLFEYVEEWAKFGRVVDKRMKEETGENIFTRKYNKQLLGEIEEIVEEITSEDVIHAPERFKSAWLDGGF